MKIKTADLIGPTLDWAVAKCLQPGYEEWRLIRWIEQEFHPSTDWGQGGPIIQKEGIELMCGLTEDMAARFKNADPHWSAFPFGRPDVLNKRYLGPTPLIAAMRCFVASKLGDEIDVPEELL